MMLVSGIFPVLFRAETESFRVQYLAHVFQDESIPGIRAKFESSQQYSDLSIITLGYVQSLSIPILSLLQGMVRQARIHAETSWALLNEYNDKEFQ